ncbi:hypothetical protein FRC01_003354 [Tulasnella sp. 417]|nr:hypothetical protein FRC01_003354 [Tulasnella sp. 417]
MEKNFRKRASREIRQYSRSATNPARANTRPKANSRDVKKLPERSHGDQRIQKKCLQEFNAFSNKIRDLAEKFGEFMRAIRPIGSSSGLIRTSKEPQESTKKVRDAFGSNSAEMWHFYARTGRVELPDALRDVPKEPRDGILLDLSRTMNDLSDNLAEFSSGLWEIPEFSDKRLTDVLLEFRNWLDYRAQYLESRRRILGENSAAARICIGRVMKEMLNHVQAVKDALQDFTGEGVKAIQNHQQRSQTKLQNMSTVATFFSAVTATTIQYNMEQKNLETVVMGLWISSLILSTASAINSQLAMHWRAAMYRSPRSALPFWASVCLDHTPLICLVGAVLAFSAGLVVFTFAADLAISVKICAAAMTSATSLILFTVIVWEIRERWQGTRKARPAPSKAEVPDRSAPRYPWLPWKSTKRSARNVQNGLSAPLETLKHMLKLFGCQFVCYIKGSANTYSPIFGRHRENPNGNHDVEAGVAAQASSAGQSIPSKTSPASAPGEGCAVTVDSKLAPGPSPTTSGFPQSKQKAAPLPAIPSESSVLFDNKAFQAKIRQSSWESSYPRRSELLGLRPVRTLDRYHLPGHEVHFSPDGTHLALCTSKGVTIFDVAQYKKQYSIPNPKSVVDRFAWSSDNSHIAIIMGTSLSIWKKKVKVKDHPLGKRIDAITRLQTPSNVFVMVDCEAHILDVQGTGTKMKLLRLPINVYDVVGVPHPQESNTEQGINPESETNHGKETKFRCTRALVNE